VGFGKSKYLELEHGPEALALMRSIKAALDPTISSTRGRSSAEENPVSLAGDLGPAARLRVAAGLEREPELAASKKPVERAGAMSPRNAAGSVGGTVLPLPRGTKGSVARHSTRQLIDAGVWLGPKNWNESITARSSTSSTARRPLRLIHSASSGIGSVQNSPDARIPPLKSWTCEPEPGSKRSTHMKANVPKRRAPFAST
jgi:hypothetical protein